MTPGTLVRTQFDLSAVIWNDPIQEGIGKFSGVEVGIILEERFCGTFSRILTARGKSGWVVDSLLEAI